jgi:hypothetical protein
MSLLDLVHCAGCHGKKQHSGDGKCGVPVQGRCMEEIAKEPGEGYRN